MENIKIEFRIAVAGGRDFTDKEYLYRALDTFIEKRGCDRLVSGGANGADKLAESYAKSRGIPITIYPAEWDKYGKSAGYRRNVLIANDCDVLLAFPTKNSKGTWHTVELAEKRDIELYILDKYYK